MKTAWESRQLNGREQPHEDEGEAAGDGGDGDQDDGSCCCCGPKCGACCKIFLKYTVARSIQLFLYIFDIATDLGVAYTDYQKGDPIFAGITLGLVFAPGFLFGIYAFTEVVTTHTGILACVKAPLWLLSIPFLPLWPILRDVHQILHGILALCPSRRKYHLEYLNKPSRAYLVKFLEAFTEAAPQILLRLYKITLRRQEMPFYEVGVLEVIQVMFSLVTLSSKLISTYQKNITTAQVINGDMDHNERFKLPCFIQITAFLWWLAFLIARFEVMALFAGSLKWWLALVIGIHVVLVFLFQTVAAHSNRARRFFIYLFTGFVFIFAYLQFNMKTRMKIAPWFSYTVYTILVMIENAVMLVLWYFTQQSLTSSYPDSDRQRFTTHRQHLIYVHYGAFCFGVIMMILTFCCSPRRSQDEEGKENKEEMKAVRLS